MSQVGWETEGQCIIRQNAKIISHLEGIKALLAGILVVLVIPVVVLLISMLVSA